jgi:integral membrane sensor domain MASE1
MAVLAGLYVAGALVTFWYFNAPESGVAFFPPAGLTVATLLITPRRTWPFWLVAFAIAEISVDLVHGQTVFMAVGFAGANIVEPLVGARLFLAGASLRALRRLAVSSCGSWCARWSPVLSSAA